MEANLVCKYRFPRARRAVDYVHPAKHEAAAQDRVQAGDPARRAGQRPLFGRWRSGHWEFLVGAKGKVTQKVEPAPGADVTAIDPSIASQIRLTIHRPTPPAIFEAWCGERGLEPVNATAFKAMTRLSYKRSKVGGAIRYEGVALCGVKPALVAVK